MGPFRLQAGSMDSLMSSLQSGWGKLVHETLEHSPNYSGSGALPASKGILDTGQQTSLGAGRHAAVGTEQPVDDFLPALAVAGLQLSSLDAFSVPSYAQQAGRGC